MSNDFFDHPILNSPYTIPTRHWELDQAGQPTQEILVDRRAVSLVTPIPKPKKQKGNDSGNQTEIVLNEDLGLSNEAQQYDSTSRINKVRHLVNFTMFINLC